MTFGEPDNTTKINKIHFLIHPGFLSREVPRMADKNPAANPYLSRVGEYEALLDKYLDEARKLGNSELMFAFAHTSREQMKSDLKAGQLYGQTLRELKKILGPRLIVLSNNNDVVNDDKAIEVAKRIAEARGFTFDKSVLTEAYGEMIGYCIERGSNRLNMAGKFERKTRIRPELADMPVYTPLDKLKKQMRREHPRISY